MKQWYALYVLVCSYNFDITQGLLSRGLTEPYISEVTYQDNPCCQAVEQSA